MPKYNYFLLLLVICIFCLAGCNKTRVIDDVDLLMLVGFDWIDESKEYLGTELFPLYGLSEDSHDRRVGVFSAKGYTTQQIHSNIQSKVPKKIESGKLLGIVLGEELAREGVNEVLYGIGEDPNIGRGLFVAIAKGTASELLSTNYNTEHILPIFLKDLMKTQSNNSLPPVNLHQYNYSYYGEGMDPYLPILANKDNQIQLIGLGFFKGDQLTYEIDYNRLFYFRILFENSTNTDFDFLTEELGHLSIVAIESTLKKKWVSKNKLELHVTIAGTLTESYNQKLTSFSNKAEIEGTIKKKLEKETKQLIEDLQKHDVDPLRIGASAKATFRDWQEEKWKEEYPTVEITPVITFNLKQTNIVH